METAIKIEQKIGAAHSRLEQNCVTLNQQLVQAKASYALKKRKRYSNGGPAITPWRVLALEAVLPDRDIHAGVELMFCTCASATLALMFAGLACATDTTDSLSGLPVSDGSSGMKFHEPMRLDPTQVCKSTQTTSFYTIAEFKTTTAIGWYSAHLKGFKDLQGYGAGRTQDILVDADGSLYVTNTGISGPDGADSNAYAITYATLKPGLSGKVLTGLLSQHLSC